MGHLIRVTNLWGYDELVRELGGDPQVFLKRFHIPSATLGSDDAFIPYRNAALLLETTAVELERPDLGLRLARWQGLEMLGPIAVIARNSQTVLGALQAIGQFLYTHCPSLRMRLQERIDDDAVQLDYQITELSAPQLRQSYELSMANAVQILKLLAGDEARPRCVSLQHSAMAGREVYQQAFDCKVLFNQSWCGWWMDGALARRRIDHADPRTLHYATRYLQSEQAADATQIGARVIELIRRLLPTGHCSIKTVAAELAMHPRTLQRRLNAEPFRYEQLLDKERRRRARYYLTETQLPLIQITGLLGYTEQAAFNNAFQRWFATTPNRYREAARRSGGF